MFVPIAFANDIQWDLDITVPLGPENYYRVTFIKRYNLKTIMQLELNNLTVISG